jgi:hypothetical protein
MLTSTFVLNKEFQTSMLASKLLAIVAMFFYWDCNILDLVMVHSKVVTGGAIASLDNNSCVSSNIGLGLCIKF